MDETTRLHPGTRDEIWMHVVNNFHSQELWPQIFIQITEEVTRKSWFASTAPASLTLCEVSSEVEVNLGHDAFQENTDDHITMLVPSACLQMCVGFFACRWLPGWVHHAVEHRCARCGGLCQPQVCLQSAFQLELYIGIIVYIWPCISQPLNWGFILESLCPSDHVFRLCSEDIFCTSQSFAAKLSQVVIILSWKVMPTNWVILLEISTVVLYLTEIHGVSAGM